MRVSLFVPETVRQNLLKITLRSLSKRHPEVTIIGPVPLRVRGFLDRFGIPITDPPLAPEKPTSFWGKVRWWWDMRSRPKWDSLAESDGVLVFWDGTAPAYDVVRRSKMYGKKLWVIRL